MNITKLALLPAALAGCFVASVAQAAPLLFEFTGRGFAGPITASFQLDSNPIPDRINDQPIIASGQIFFDNIDGIYNGIAATASTISFGTGLASQFQISGSPSGFAQFGGDTVFSGMLSSPVFTPGTYNFGGFSSGTLTISALSAGVPEPATWALMLLGFGSVGFALRRRRTVATVTCT